jgi:putative nucleotidyltransferase with HDIG domain
MMALDNDALKDKAYAAIGALPKDRFAAVSALFQKLEAKDADTFYHSLRVGMMMEQIGCLFGIGGDDLLIAGYLHDIGKLEIPTETLRKKTAWTTGDMEIMKSHVMAGYEILTDNGFAAAADIMVRHHQFQKVSYPKVIPTPKTDCGGEISYINCCGRLLALADCYDALHRVNSRSKGKALSNSEIQEKMFELNPYQDITIERLYETGIFR